MIWNQRIRILLLLAVFLGLGGCSRHFTPLSVTAEGQAQPISSPFIQNKKLGRGINLGNALEAPTEGSWGVTLKACYFRVIKQAGFNSVRIPIRWSAHADQTPPYTISPQFFARVDWAVHQALSNHLMVVINVHHYTKLMEDSAGQKGRFLSLWNQIARHYQTYPPQLLFEILNEPHDQLTPALWNAYLAEALSIIRKSNPARTVVIGTAGWGGIRELQALVIPEEEQNAIVTIHYYEPFHFTHQGAEWVAGSNAWLGTTWNATPAELAALNRDFDTVARWASRNRRPIFVGEFGAYSKADLISRARWTNAVARAAEQRHFSWAYWEFCSGFGAYNPQKEAWIPQLLRALIP